MGSGCRTSAKAAPEASAQTVTGVAQGQADGAAGARDGATLRVPTATQPGRSWGKDGAKRHLLSAAHGS